MTTEARAHDERTRPLAAARLGAIAAVTPVMMFLAWTAISHWGGTPVEFIQLLAVISAIALVAGWVVGGRSGRTIRSILLDAIAFPTIAWLIFLPIAAIWSTWPWGLLYGLVSSLYVIPLLTPFGAGWALTYYLLRRGMGV